MIASPPTRPRDGPRASSRSDGIGPIDPDEAPDWVKIKNPNAPAGTRVGMVKQPLDPAVARAALEECRRQAQKCIDESAKAETPALRASWLALAEQWVHLAERLADREG
jgi:hypothetical protein